MGKKLSDVLLTKDHMLTLTTKRLLAYKEKLLRYPDFAPDYIISSDEMMTKSHPLWMEAYQNVKDILATREHVEK